MNPMPMISVKDVRASARFYEQLLGAASGHGGTEYEQLFAGDRLVLQLHDCQPDASHGPLRDLEAATGNGVLLWFEAEDFNALLARVREFAIPLERDAVNPFSGKRELWLYDPDGYRVVLADAKGEKPRGH